MAQPAGASPVSLKVMRLYAPRLVTETHLCTIDASTDPPFAAATNEDAGNPDDAAPWLAAAPAGAASGPVALAPLLKLPDSFGNIYVGQTFRSYINVCNDTRGVVRNVSVKAELQAGGRRALLLDARDPATAAAAGAQEPDGTKRAASFSPGDLLDMVISHPLVQPERVNRSSRRLNPAVAVVLWYRA